MTVSEQKVYDRYVKSSENAPRSSRNHHHATTQSIRESGLVNCNGIRKAVINRRKVEQQQQFTTLQTEKKQQPPTIPVKPELVDRLVENIIRRSEKVDTPDHGIYHHTETVPIKTAMSPTSVFNI